MQELLFLAHRIPYPPNKGDKIRSYHLLRFLAQRYVVHLATFVDDENDWQDVDAVKALCNGGEVCVRPLHPRLARVKSLSGLATGEALTLPYYRDAGMRGWVDSLLTRRPVQHAVVFSSPMAQYVEHHAIRRIADLVDVDSDKWTQYAAKARWPGSWIYGREGRRLFDYERKIAGSFDATFFVSPAEAALFHRLAPESAARVSSFGNGVDTEYFSPDAIYQNPFGDSRSTIVFTGAMDYWPNVDAVTWFAREAFPVVQRARPDARFCIVGSRPTSQVLELGRLQGVEVTGTVPDVRPYLAHARMIVAPLRIARGVQNKVLEAMAMGRPTLVTPQALEGIDAEPGRELVLAPEDGAAFGEAALQLLGSDDVAMGRAARDRVMRDYAWSAHLKVVGQALDRKGAALPESDTAGSAAITSLGGMAR